MGCHYSFQDNLNLQNKLLNEFNVNRKTMGNEVTGGPADDYHLSKPQLCQLRLWPCQCKHL